MLVNDDQRSTQGRHPGPGKVPWTCQHCRRPAYPGWVMMGAGELNRRRRELEEWETRHPAGKAMLTADLMSYPVPAAWEVICQSCDDLRRVDGDEDDELYSFGTDRASTLSEVLDWCAHLSEKTWIADTNWASILRQLSKAAAAR